MSKHSIPPKIRRRLGTSISKLKGLRDERKPTYRLIHGLLLMVLLVVLIFLVAAFYDWRKTAELNPTLWTLLFIFFGVAAAWISAAARLRDCSEAVDLVEFAFDLDDMEALQRSLARLSCLSRIGQEIASNLRGLREDVKQGMAGAGG